MRSCTSPITTPLSKQTNPCRGVAQTSSSQEICQVYQRIAIAYRPDKVDRAEATRRFQEIQLVYDVLQEPDRCIVYDHEAFGHVANAATPTSPADANDNGLFGNGGLGGKWPRWAWTRDMPPSSESPGGRAWGAQAQNEWYANFLSDREEGDGSDGSEEEEEAFSQREEERYRREQAEG